LRTGDRQARGRAARGAGARADRRQDRGRGAVGRGVHRAALMASAPPTTLPDVRSDFPVLSREWNGQRVTYVDSAATSQKPNQVLVAMDRFLRESNASVHRGLYDLGREATDL